MSSYIYGIDLGGTKIEMIVLDRTDTSKEIFRKRISTNQEEGYDSILKRIGSLIDEVSSEVGQVPTRIGIGTPGIIDTVTGLLRGSNTQCLNKKPLKNDLEELTKFNFVMDNDANCFALAEATMGAGRDANTVFGVILGTGVGAGIVINKQVLKGKQGIAGEWGHNIVEHNGTACYCGKSGCVEATISGPALANFYYSLDQKEKISFNQVYQRALDNDTSAKKTVDRLLNYFGQGIAVIVNILDPDVIVIGGGLSKVQELYHQGANQAKSFIFNPNPQISIVENQLGDSAGVIGAAMLTI